MLQKIYSDSKYVNFLISTGLVLNFYQRNSRDRYFDIVPEINPNSIFYPNIIGINVGGKGFTLNQAINSCAGEIVERMSLRSDVTPPHYAKIDLTKYFSLRELKRKKLDRFYHTKIVKVLKNKYQNKFRMPSFLFYLSSEKNKFFTSVGTAFATSYKVAYKKAVLEAIERHSLMYAWYKNIQIKLVRVKDAKKMKYCRPKWYMVMSDIEIPVYLCVIKKNGKYFFGSACNENSSTAMAKSYLEALQLFTSSKFNINKSNPLHAAFLRLIKNNPFRLTNNITTPKDFSFRNIEDRLTIYHCEITHPLFYTLGSVVRVFIPTLLQLTAKNGPRYYLNESLQTKNRITIPFV